VAGAKGDGEHAASLMPVADRRTALALVADVTGAELDAPEFTAAGPRAHWIDPWGWGFLGVALLDHGAVRREGRWRRTTSYVPFARVQSVSARQGVLQRSLDLATIHLDLPKGAERWTARHRAHADAAGLVQTLSALARKHRLSESVTP
jgi:putative membrane protein